MATFPTSTPPPEPDISTTLPNQCILKPPPKQHPDPHLPQHPLQSIRHNVTFSNWQNHGLSRIQKSVRIVFQPQFCPTHITPLQNQFGRQFHASEQLGPPSLQAGSDGGRRGVAYTTFPHHIIALEQNSCKWAYRARCHFNHPPPSGGLPPTLLHKRMRPIVGHNKMVEQSDVHQRQRGGQSACEKQVGI